MSVLPGAKRIVEYDPRATKRPGQQHSLARGRVSTVTVTNEHPLNVTSPTDTDPLPSVSTSQLKRLSRT
jgi:hypothetical protein